MPLRLQLIESAADACAKAGRPRDVRRMLQVSTAAAEQEAAWRPRCVPRPASPDPMPRTPRGRLVLTHALTPPPTPTHTHR